jgi:hypothetical protein
MRVWLTLLLAVASFVRAQISPPAVDKEANARLEQDLAAFNPHYEREPRTADCAHQNLGQTYWCLKESLQPDGSFKVNIGDGLLEDADYYGTSFLARVGFFDPGQRFWTNRDFPNAAEVKGRIISFVRSNASTGPTGDHYRSTLEALGVR